jgi:spore coat polysaccharide biosynthesis protein SpsF
MGYERMSEKIGVFLQARLDSNRLPEKALLSLGGITIVEHAMRALTSVEADHYVLLTDDRSANRLRPLARLCYFDLFVGDPEDVLDRFNRAAQRYGVDTIVRATGDNPFVSPEATELALSLRRSNDADFAALAGLPLGTGVEVVCRRALEIAWKKASKPYDREHVTPFLYNHPERFSIVRAAAPEDLRCPEARVTLDTWEDYRHLQGLVEDLRFSFPVEIRDIVGWYRESYVPVSRAVGSGARR